MTDSDLEEKQSMEGITKSRQGNQQSDGIIMKLRMAIA